MQNLVAKVPILYKGKLYSVGDKLPTNNPQMVDAWNEAGTAAWIDDEEEKKTVKARPVTAETGLAGKALTSESETGEDLVGKVPKTAARKKAQPKG